MMRGLIRKYQSRNSPLVALSGLLFAIYIRLFNLILDAWLGTLASTMSRDVSDIHREPNGFLSVAIEGMSFFISLFLKEKDTFGFLGAP